MPPFEVEFPELWARGIESVGKLEIVEEVFGEPFEDFGATVSMTSPLIDAWICEDCTCVPAPGAYFEAGPSGWPGIARLGRDIWGADAANPMVCKRMESQAVAVRAGQRDR